MKTIKTFDGGLQSFLGPSSFSLSFLTVDSGSHHSSPPAMVPLNTSLFFFFTRFLLLSSVSRYISSFYPQLLTFISYPAKIGIFQSVPLSCERCIFSFSYGRLGGLRLTRTGPQSRSYVSKQQRVAKGAVFILSFHRVLSCVSFWVPGTVLGAHRPSETFLMRLTCRDW